jgi:hypothetical protein
MAKKQEEGREEPKPIATTYYAVRAGGGWHVKRLEVYPGGRVVESIAMENPSRLVVRERLRVLFEGVLP